MMTDDKGLKQPYCTAPAVDAMFKSFRCCGLYDQRQHQNLDGRRNAALRRKELTRREGPRKMEPRDKITPLDFTCVQDAVNNLDHRLLLFHVRSLLPLKNNSVLVANLLYRQNVHRSVCTIMFEE